jgi:LPS-assembly protein
MPPLCSPSRPRQAYRLALFIWAAVPLCGIAHADGLLCPSDPRSGLGPFAKETKPSIDAGLDTDSDQVTAELGANGNTVLHLQGNVIARQGDREVRSNDAQYDRATGALTAMGSVTYQDPIVRLSGSDGKYSPSAGAQVRSAQFELRQRNGHGSAKTLDLTPKGILNLKDVTFTTCHMTDKSWELNASTLTLDTAKQVGTGRDATIDFEGVPVLYLPWLSFPLSSERKSGFLFPAAGDNSTSGAELEVPYYWNIAPNADLTFSPMYYSRRGVDLAGDARLLTDDQDGELQWHFLPDDQLFQSEEQGVNAANTAAGLPESPSSSSDRSFLTVHDVATLPDNLRVLVDAANVSDPLYFQDFGTGPETTSTAFLQRLIELSYRDENWNVGAEAEQYQPVNVVLAADYLPDQYRPYALAPRLYADGDFGWGPSELFRYGFDSELVDFTRAVGITGWRLDLTPNVGLDYENPGFFIRTKLAWDYTQYELDNILPGEENAPSRSLPITSFDTGLKFDRLVGANGDRTLTLEPRMLYLYVPYRNQDQLPLFDTALPDLNTVELFRTNRYVGDDRISDADQVTAGVTSRLLNTDSGQQYLTATVGQAYYIETPRVQLPGENLEGQEKSDLVGDFVVSAYQNWNVDLNLDWNPDESQEERTFVQLQYKPEAESVINVAYRYQRDVVLSSALAAQGEVPAGLGTPSLSFAQGQSLNQTEVSTAWPIARNWRLLARWVYDLDAHEGLDRLLGFEYRSCCWRVRVLARRYLVNGTGQQDTAFMFQLQLSGLAGVGPATDAFLGSAIRGYSPPSSSR